MLHRDSDDKHFLEYVVLIFGLVLILALMLHFKSDKSVLYVISGSGSLFYALWGIIHHAVEGRLTKVVALEYVFFGGLMFLLLFAAITF